MPRASYKHLDFSATADKVAVNTACHLWGFLVGCDGSNDPTISVYDNATTASGNELLPTTTYDASALGLNGVSLPAAVMASNGITVSVTLGSGTCEVVVLFS